MLPVSRQQFADFFFSDDAPCNAVEWHKTRDGDKDMEWGEWVPLPDQPGVVARDTMFRTPIVGAPFGPPETRVHKIERVTHPEGGPWQMQAFSITPDVPFGDMFYVFGRWTVVDLPPARSASPSSPSSPTDTGMRCKLSIEGQMVFIKNSLALRAVKSVAKSRTLGDLTKSFSSWSTNALKWLETPIAARYIAAHALGVLPRRPGEAAPPPLAVAAPPAAAAPAAEPEQKSTPPPAEQPAPTPAAPTKTEVVPVTPAPSSSKAASASRALMSNTVALLVGILAVWIMQTFITSSPAADASNVAAPLSRISIALLLVVAGLALLCAFGHQRLRALEQSLSQLHEQREETTRLLRTLAEELRALRPTATRT